MPAQILKSNDKPAFALTESPNSNWKYGEHIEESSLGRAWKDSERRGWKVVDTRTESVRSLYKLMDSGIAPRPIALVSTVSPEGINNLAPFSWFNMVSHNPPTVSISINRLSSGQYKDTMRNIITAKTFTVNIVSEPWVEQANFASVDAPSGTSEWPASGLTPIPSTEVKPPRVKESAFSMECEIFHMHDLCPVGSSQPTGTLVLGLVKLIHVRKAVLTENGSVDFAKLRAVSKLGGLTFGRTGEGFDLPGLKWSEISEEVAHVQVGMAS